MQKLEFIINKQYDGFSIINGTIDNINELISIWHYNNIGECSIIEQYDDKKCFNNLKIFDIIIYISYIYFRLNGAQTIIKYVIYNHDIKAFEKILNIFNICPELKKYITIKNKLGFIQGDNSEDKPYQRPFEYDTYKSIQGQMLEFNLTFPNHEIISNTLKTILKYKDNVYIQHEEHVVKEFIFTLIKTAFTDFITNQKQEDIKNKPYVDHTEPGSLSMQQFHDLFSYPNTIWIVGRYKDYNRCVYAYEAMISVFAPDRHMLFVLQDNLISPDYFSCCSCCDREFNYPSEDDTDKILTDNITFSIDDITKSV